jgi:uncharacterized protein (TIGR01777 family)
MKILVSGSSGLVGSSLMSTASALRHETVRLVRKRGQPGAVYWDPDRGMIDLESIEGFDAVVHLAGESIAAHRWSANQKRKIRDSRVKGTSLLATTLGRLKRPPSVLVSASAIGYYGDRGEEVLQETSSPGSDFLADVCKQWEGATEPANRAGVRVVNLRTGIVLARDGGALPKMAMPFKFGAGGKIGSGRQYMSWIDLDDEVHVILHCLQKPEVRGPVNAVAPSPVTNAEFTKILGRVLSRPTFFPLPAFVARSVLGEMADGLLLSSQRVQPSKLLSTDYKFRHSNLEEALRTIFRR